MAARSLSATPKTRDEKLVARRSWSPMVVASILRGDMSPAFPLLPTGLTVSSPQQ